MRQQRRVGRAPRRLHLVAGGIDHIAVSVIARKNAAHIADIVGEGGDDKMGVIGRWHVRVQRPAAQDVVASERHQHGVLDVVVERVAVADALQRDARDRGHDFDQARLRGAEAPFHIGGEERTKRVRRQFRHRDHDVTPPNRTPGHGKSVALHYRRCMTTRPTGHCVGD